MSAKYCSIWWCDKKHYAKGYCVAHYRANERYGSPFGKHAEQMQRIQAAIKRARHLIASFVLDNDMQVGNILEAYRFLEETK